MLKTLLVKTIQVPQYDKSIRYLDTNKETTFAAWLTDCKIHDNNLFVTVGKSAPHYVRMIYHNVNHNHVVTVVNNLYKSVETFFGKDVAIDLLGDGYSYSTSMPATSSEASYFSALANTYAANPQDLDNTPLPPQPPRKQRPTPAWFGPNPVLENIEVTPSVSSPSSQLTNDGTTKLSELETRIKALSDADSNLNHTIFTFLNL